MKARLIFCYSFRRRFCEKFYKQKIIMKEGDKILEDKKRFMQMAVDFSQYALDSKCGGPFGAIVVKDGAIVGSSGNRVFSNCDPTAHAEVMAIRDACKNLQTIDLSGCEIYASAEPCPMCTAAIYWSKLEAVYFSNTEDDALEHGFMDKEIMTELRKPKEKRSRPFVRIKNEQAIKIFDRALKKAKK
jgi:tRNA(Arg) A34 adenosine deaminase TadA